MEKIIINEDACIGCGLCVSKNPDYLVFNEMGHAEPVGKEVKKEDKPNILEAIEQCPTEAIRIEEEPVGKE
jgi:ferredoxin